MTTTDFGLVQYVWLRWSQQGTKNVTGLRVMWNQQAGTYTVVSANPWNAIVDNTQIAGYAAEYASGSRVPAGAVVNVDVIRSSVT